MRLERADLIAFVATTDAGRAKTFYQHVLGLRLVSDEAFALVFDANGTMLRVQKVSQLQPQPFTVVGWAVDDIEAVIRSLIAHGVAMLRIDGLPQDDLGVWEADKNTQVAWFRDPDGNLLSLTRFIPEP